MISIIRPLQENIYSLDTALRYIAWKSRKESLGPIIVSLAAAKGMIEAYKKLCADRVDEQTRQIFIKQLNKLDRKIEFGEKLIAFLEEASPEVDPRVIKVMAKLENKDAPLPFEKLETYASYLRILSKHPPNQKTEELLLSTRKGLKEAHSEKLKSEPSIQKWEMLDQDLIDKGYANAVSLNTGKELISARYLEGMLKQGVADPFSLTYPLHWLERSIREGHCEALTNCTNEEKSPNLGSLIDPSHDSLCCLNPEPWLIPPEKTIDHLMFLQEHAIKSCMGKLGSWICIGERHCIMIVYSSGKACLLNQYGDGKRGPYPYHALFGNLSQAGAFFRLLFGEIAQSLPEPEACSSAWISFSAETWKENDFGENQF